MVKADDSKLWQEHIGQLNFTDVQNTFLRLPHCTKDLCRISALCKIKKVSVPKETEVKSTKPLEKVFIDILRPLNPPSVHGFRYALMTVAR